MSDSKGDNKCKHDQTFQFADGRVVRINSKTNTCKTWKPCEADRAGCFVPPASFPTHLGVALNPIPYPIAFPMPYPIPHSVPYPMPPYYPMLYTIGQSPSSDCTEENLWEEHKNDAGRTYYYNRETKKSHWEKPDNLNDKMKKKEPGRPKPPKLPKKYSNVSKGFLGLSG